MSIGWGDPVCSRTNNLYWDIRAAAAPPPSRDESREDRRRRSSEIGHA